MRLNVYWNWLSVKYLCNGTVPDDYISNLFEYKLTCIVCSLSRHQLGQAGQRWGLQPPPRRWQWYPPWPPETHYRSKNQKYFGITHSTWYVGILNKRAHRNNALHDRLWPHNCHRRNTGTRFGRSVCCSHRCKEKLINTCRETVKYGQHFENWASIPAFEELWRPKPFGIQFSLITKFIRLTTEDHGRCGTHHSEEGRVHRTFFCCGHPESVCLVWKNGSS